MCLEHVWCGVIFWGLFFLLCVKLPPENILMLNVSSPSWRKCKNLEGLKEVIGLSKAKKLLCDVT